MRTVCIPRDAVPYEHEVRYWEALLETRRAQIRFCEAPINGLLDIYKIMDDEGLITFYAWDPIYERICVEATLCNFTGLAAQLHFSVHPDYLGKVAREICEETLKWMFQLRRQNEDQPLIKSLFGMTPVTNRLAVKFVKAMGFDIIGTLPAGMKDIITGQYVDAMISMRTAQ